jgi:hypothetical protein
MHRARIRLLSIALVLVSFVTFPVIESSFSRYSGPAVIGMFFANCLAFLGAIYLWQASKSAFPIWLTGYALAVVPILLLPNESAVAPDQPWIWIAVPVIACIVVFMSWRDLKW